MNIASDIASEHQIYHYLETERQFCNAAA